MLIAGQFKDPLEACAAKEHVIFELDAGTESILSEFAVGTKLWEVADTPEGCASVQRGPQQAAELGREESYVVQQREM